MFDMDVFLPLVKRYLAEATANDETTASADGE